MSGRLPKQLINKKNHFSGKTYPLSYRPRLSVAKSQAVSLSGANFRQNQVQSESPRVSWQSVDARFGFSRKDLRWQSRR